jgi:biotin synthase
MNNIEQILNQSSLDKNDIISLLNTNDEERKLLFAKANQVKTDIVGKKTYFRGLVEFSNNCAKNCYYCGIRHDNKNLDRFDLTDDEILEAVKFAWDSNYRNVVLQSGELSGNQFTDRIDNLLKKMMEMTDGQIGITLSCGEQSLGTYQKWHNSGARRYLLRIETSNRDLYYKIHPNNKIHDYEQRLECLKHLKEAGYHVGTGVMVGLPFQTIEDLADDLLFMKILDIDMCGMGPYIEHKDTPLYKYRNLLLPIEERFNLALKMIAILRILMPDINIAAATALQAIDKMGREKGLKVGANIIMPNITPGEYRDSYKLYENKPCTDEQAEDCLNCLEVRITIAGDEIGYGELGDSKHYLERNKINEEIQT